ncbi:MAG: hypothetical protein ABH868_01095 [bacterium]
MKIKVFGKKDCQACAATKEKLSFFLNKWDLADDVPIIFYDLETLEGLTEAAIQDALEAPTTIIEKDNHEIARWEKEVPQSQNFKEFFTEEIKANKKSVTA